MSAEHGGTDRRPSPEALLRAAAAESRGRLKIFLGAAPGVGKTYEMLVNARAKRAAGIEIVAGIVETHGRKETEALLAGLETVPRRRVDYRGRVLEEMDLDAILARRPALVLVDELAHTNAPGSRHSKRYMDVEELLAAGIDVWTTLNIQHVESLNDVVARITRIRVRETVPDSVIDLADDVEVIDLTPDDLIQRLKDGKVYVPENAERAIRHYFSPGNLTALRELALRRTAQRVDEQLVTHMQAHAIAGPWAAGERVLACIGAAPDGAALVRYARRLADRLHAPWTALTVETPRSYRLSEAARDRIAASQRMAEKLGGEAITVPGRAIADEIVAYARASNATHIIVGKSSGGRWLELLRGSVAHEVIRRAGEISVHVIGGGGAAAAEQFVATRPAPGPGAAGAAPYAAATAMVALALGAGLLLQQVLAVTNVALVFLTAVLASAVAHGLLPSLYACLLSVLAYNFFFLPPLHTFTIAEPENVLALLVLAMVAVIASHLTARSRAQAIAARQRARTTEELYRFSRKLAGVVSLDDLLWATAYQIAAMLHVRVVLLLPDTAGSLAVRAGYPPEDELDAADLAAAAWCWANNRTAGRGADTLPGAKRLFLPMRTGRGAVAVVGLDGDRPGPLLTPDQRRLLEALADQAALAIERVNLAEEFERAKIAAETDRLRAALLTSISHDLRTPLASIIGAAGSLRNYRNLLDDAARADLVATIEQEAERLNRFVGNLLDMTRLEAGAIELRREPVDLGEIAGSALRRAGALLAGHRVEVRMAPDLPLLDLDPVLLEQALFNLLDNAAKYAPAGSLVSVLGERDDGNIRLRVMDEGDGIPASELDRIFEKFHRIRNADRQRAGTGLGLAICRGFVEAIGGSATAANRTDRPGAVFTLAFPAAIASALRDAVRAADAAASGAG